MAGDTSQQAGRRTLVTGGAGFVGQHVITALHQRGERVVALQHRRKLPADIAAQCCEIIEGDLADEQVQLRAVQRVDRICHLAAYLPPNMDDAAEAEACLRVNALATLGLARAAVERGVERFVYLSAANSYGPGDGPVAEAAPVFPSRFAPYYLTSKLAGEIYLDYVCGPSETQVVTLRIGTPYGPGEPERKVIPALLALAARGEPLRLRHGGRPTFNFVYVEDVAHCVAVALEGGASGVYNFASGENTSLLGLAEALVELYAERPPPISIEPASEDCFLGFPAISVEKACRTWTLAPLSLREGLRRYRG